MAINHTVKQGECINSIAYEYGFFPDTIWNHPQNKELKEKRKDPNVLFPGDVVFVPDKRVKEVNKATDQQHRFRMKNVPAKFTVRLVNDDDSPRGGVKYLLTVDGEEFEGQSTSGGEISVSVPPGAKTGKLELTDKNGEEEEYDIALGYLDPIEEMSGVQGRLRGLGYYYGDISGENSDELGDAIREFQEDNGMEVTGEVDDALRSQLQSDFGS